MFVCLDCSYATFQSAEGVLASSELARVWLSTLTLASLAAKETCGVCYALGTPASHPLTNCPHMSPGKLTHYRCWSQALADSMKQIVELGHCCCLFDNLDICKEVR